MLIPTISVPAHNSDVDNDHLMTFMDKLSVLGPVMIDIETRDEDRVKQLMRTVIDKTNSNSLSPCYLQGLDMDQDALATSLLDAGLHGLFFNYPTIGGDAELEIFKKVLRTFPRARVGVVAQIQPITTSKLIANIESIITANRSSAVHYYFRFSSCPQEILYEVVAAIKVLIEKTTCAHDNIQVYIGLPSECYESSKDATKIATTMSDNTMHAVFKAKPFGTTSIGNGDYSSAAEGIDILSAFIACVRSDRPDGLFTTVVCDEHGVSLGLVYSNDVSICAAVQEKKGIYWSRSRGGLWRKGDSSGMHQELLAIHLDCDGDALRFTVIQHGSPPSFCHLMTRTCWGEAHGFQHLQSILQSRLVSAPEGSYTKRLFTDQDLLMKKLVEEAQELAEAETHDEVAGEAADLMYFLMVRCVAAGVSLKDIEKKLDYRSLKVSRRPGNAKEYRTQAAAAMVPSSAKLQAAAAHGTMESLPSPPSK